MLDEDDARQLVSASATTFADRFLGRGHELKFGVEFERTTSRFTYGLPGGRAYMDMGGQPYLYYDWGGSDTASSVAHTAAFVQDQWSVNDRLTLSPGLRIDATRGGVRGGDTVFSTTPVSGRIGLAWDLVARHATVLRAHYGRYTDPAFGLPIQLTDPAGLTPLTLYRILPGGGEQVVYSNPTAFRNHIGTGLKQPHVDQFVGGLEHDGGCLLPVQHRLRVGARGAVPRRAAGRGADPGGAARHTARGPGQPCSTCARRSCSHWAARAGWGSTSTCSTSPTRARWTRPGAYRLRCSPGRTSACRRRGWTRERCTWVLASPGRLRGVPGRRPRRGGVSGDYWMTRPPARS
jgi:hypothetical protein